MLDLFIKIGYLVLGLNFVVFAMCFSNQGKAYRIFTVYIAVIGVIQIASRVLSSLGMGNLFLSHFYFIAQFIILSFFYLELLKEKSGYEIVLSFQGCNENKVEIISVDKAVVTQASAAIPVVPLYISLLFKIMKEIINFLKTIKNKTTHIVTPEVPYYVYFVMGNSSCDMDSFLSSIVYSYFKNVEW